MTFEPGHPFHPRKDGSKPGASKDFRERQRNVALVFREKWPAEEQAEWLLSMIMGVDPNGKRGVNGEDLSPPVAEATRMKAFREYANRCHGLPAQHVVLEAEVRAALGVVTASVSSEAIKNMPPEKLAALRAMLGSVVSPGTSSPVLMPAPATAHVVDVPTDEG